MSRWRDQITLGPECHEYILNNALSPQLRPALQKVGLSSGGVIDAKSPYYVSRAGSNIHVALFVEKGQGQLTTPEGNQRIDQGMVVILPAERPFEFGCVADQQWHMAWLLLEANDRWPITKGSSRQVFQTPKVHWIYNLTKLIALEAHIQSNELFTPLIQRLAKELRCIFEQALGNQNTKSTHHGVHHAMSVAEQKLYHKWTVAELAALANMSESYFYRCCHQLLGQSPHQYLIAHRMKSAKDMLSTTDRPINHIASRLGYSDVMRFSQAFKLRHGCSPTAYRQQQR